MFHVAGPRKNGKLRSDCRKERGKKAATIDYILVGEVGHYFVENFAKLSKLFLEEFLLVLSPYLVHNLHISLMLQMRGVGTTWG